MNFPLNRPRRLVVRGEAGLACDEDGLALGGVSLARAQVVREGVRGCEVRPLAEVDRILRAAYGPQADEVVARVHRGLCRAAEWIEAGDLGRAGVQAVGLGLPDIDPESMAKLAEIADLEKAGAAAWETEPRIPKSNFGGGRWTTAGGGGGPRPATGSRGSAGSATRGGAPIATRHNKAPRKTPPRTQSVVTPPRPRSPSVASMVAGAGAVALPAGARGVVGDIALPVRAIRLGGIGLLAAAAAALDDWGLRNGRDQVNDAIRKFGLDPTRPADVTAARAYVWSRYYLPRYTAAPYYGPELDAASEAVMRLVSIRPNLFDVMRPGEKPDSLIIMAANAGMSDYAVQSRARPKGVDPALQTYSWRARAAIAEDLKTGRMQAHHLVAANVWASRVDITGLAVKAGWKPDSPSVLIALPADQATYSEMGGVLPIHNGSHPSYDKKTQRWILDEEGKYPKLLTPFQARSILDTVALRNREKIMAHEFGEYLKVGA